MQRNSPLEIVTNMHSKRRTEVMVLFDNGSRFYGSDAASLIARKPHQTPTSLGVMLGRDEDHPAVKVLGERYFPLTPSYNATRKGVCLQVNGQEFTPEELVAMVLVHAKEITADFTSSNLATIKDCVLTVPSFYTQHEREALLDAAELADLNVLALIDEVTASALNFGMDRIDEEPKNVLFYNLGAGALQVSIVKYHSYETKSYGKVKQVGSFEVKGKGWDSTYGGMAFDARLVDFMAEEFNAQWNKKRADGETKDIRNFPRPMTKLRLQANKVKHILSANKEMPVFMDALYDDTNYVTSITRAKFEEISHDLLERSTKPIEQALKAANMTLQDIDMVELIGGGMRVPKVKEAIQNFLGENLELGLHINSDESMALGAAFHGANVSTAFKVRQIGMTDVNPFPMSVSLSDLAVEEEEGKGGIGSLFGIGKKTKGKDAAATEEEEEEAWHKEATIFKSNSKVGIKKTIAFTHETDVQCSIDYVDDEHLPEGTEKSLGRYSISGVAKFAAEMEKKGLGKPKVSLQFQLDTSGITGIVKAEAVVEEMIMVTEEIEVEEDADEETSTEEDSEETKDESTTEKGEETAPEEKKEESTDEKKEESAEEKKDEEKTNETATEGEKTEENESSTDENKKEEKKPKKPKKKVKKTVEKEKKKIHRRTLVVKKDVEGKVQPYSEVIMLESKAKLQLLDDLDRERILLEEAKNKVESYIYHIKNKMADNEDEIAKVTTEEQRTSVLSMASEAEEWMYDEGYDADLATFEAKYTELSEPAEAIFFRLSELIKRPEAIAALNKKLSKVEDLITKWETEKPQVTAEERESVMERVSEARKWVADKVDAQADVALTDPPAFNSVDVPLQTKKIEALVGRLSKKPKPKPVEVKKEENATDVNITTDTEGLEGDTESADEAGSNEDSTSSGDSEAPQVDDTAAGDEKVEDEL